MNNEFHAAIVNERKRQIDKGYNAAHDAEHGLDHLLMWAQEYAAMGKVVQSMAMIEAARELLMSARSYIEDPGNWSALDGRRAHILALIWGD